MADESSAIDPLLADMSAFHHAAHERGLQARRSRIRATLIEAARSGTLHREARTSQAPWVWSTLGAVAAVFLVFWFARPRPLSVEVDGRAPLEQLVFVATSEPVTLAFSDGSRIAAARQSRLQIERLRTDGADLVLHEGHLEARVEASTAGLWRVQAGAYRIEATTSAVMTIAWAPDRQALDVSLERGAATVRLPGVAEARQLGEGDSLSLTAAEPSNADALAEHKSSSSALALAERESSSNADALAGRPSSFNADVLAGREPSSNADALVGREPSSDADALAGRPSSSSADALAGRPSSSSVDALAGRPSSSNADALAGRPSSSNADALAGRPSSSSAAQALAEDISVRSVAGMNKPDPSRDSASAPHDRAENEPPPSRGRRSRAPTTRSSRGDGDLDSTPIDPVPPAAAPADWRTLAQQGDHVAAIEAIEATGFAKACAAFNATALLELADTARYARRTGRAKEALIALRRRFPETSEAATAAFDLGRLASQSKSGCSSAVRWYRTFLAERGQGSMVAEAERRIAICEAGARAP